MSYDASLVLGCKSCRRVLLLSQDASLVGGHLYSGPTLLWHKCGVICESRGPGLSCPLVQVAPWSQTTLVKAPGKRGLDSLGSVTLGRVPRDAFPPEDPKVEALK